MTRIIQPEIEFVNEKLQELLDRDRSPLKPEYEGGLNPHNQPRGSVARPKAAILSKYPPCKPVTIASRVRAIDARVRVSRWLAWIRYFFNGVVYE